MVFRPIHKKYGATIESILNKAGKFEEPVDSWVIEAKPIGYRDVWFANKAGCGKYRIKVGKQVVASWELYQMKNCCGICVSTVAMVEQPFRKNGLGLVLNQIRIDLARMMGYGLLLCTDVTSNVPQQKILKANGWKLIHKFINPRTNNELGIHVIGL